MLGIDILTTHQVIISSLRFLVQPVQSVKKGNRNLDALGHPIFKHTEIVLSQLAFECHRSCKIFSLNTLRVERANND